MSNKGAREGSTVPFLHRLRRFCMSNRAEPYSAVRFNERLEHNIEVNRRVVDETFKVFEERCLKNT